MKIQNTAITLLGLGPGSWEDITMQARAILERAAREKTRVYVRTLQHPTIEPLQDDLPDLHLVSFDTLYEGADDWETLYQTITTTICTQAAHEPVIYAVPGHPLIGEYSVSLILKQARAQGLSTSIVSGLSFLEPVCAALEMDPFTLGTQILDATALAGLQQEEIAGKLIPTTPLLVVQIYNRRVASHVKSALGTCYPDEWPVKLICAAGVKQDETVVEMPLYALDRHHLSNLLCTLYVPPLGEMEALNLPETLRTVTTRLYHDPVSHSWDDQNTSEEGKHALIEEASAAVAAMEEDNIDQVVETLGNLLFQVYAHAEVARMENVFNIDDIFTQINAKLLHLYPQLFCQSQERKAGHQRAARSE